ncbi:HAMP domain-containing protein [Methylobacterium sp. P31]
MLFLSTFGAASLCLCLFLYFEVRQSTIESLYRAVTREALRLNHLSSEGLLERTDSAQDLEQNGRQITLFRDDGSRIAGADLPFPSRQRWSKPFRIKASLSEDAPDLFCFAAPRPPDTVLLVCRSSREIWDIQQVFRRVLLLSTAAIALIGVFAAVILGSLSLRQIQSITESAKSIMEGDLSGRLSLDDLSGDLRQLAETVNEMLSQLERLMLEVKNSSENIAHDLRTPLTRVLAKLERAIRSVDNIESMKEAQCRGRFGHQKYRIQIFCSSSDIGAGRPPEAIGIQERGFD